MVIVRVVMIENVAATSFNQASGALCMMIIGSIIASTRRMSKEEVKEIKNLPYKEVGATEYIRK